MAASTNLSSILDRETAVARQAPPRRASQSPPPLGDAPHEQKLGADRAVLRVHRLVEVAARLRQHDSVPVPQHRQDALLHRAGKLLQLGCRGNGYAYAYAYAYGHGGPAGVRAAPLGRETEPPAAVAEVVAERALPYGKAVGVQAVRGGAGPAEAARALVLRAAALAVPAELHGPREVIPWEHAEAREARELVGVLLEALDAQEEVELLGGRDKFRRVGRGPEARAGHGEREGGAVVAVGDHLEQYVQGEMLESQRHTGRISFGAGLGRCLRPVV